MRGREGGGTGIDVGRRRRRESGLGARATKVRTVKIRGNERRSGRGLVGSDSRQDMGPRRNVLTVRKRGVDVSGAGGRGCGTVGARSAEREEFTRLSGEGDGGRGTSGTVGGTSSSQGTLV